MLSLLKPRQPLARPRSPDEERVIEVHGRSLPLLIRQHDRATRITLRIEPGGRSLRMTVPRGLAKREISAFLDRHQAWLAGKLEKFESDTGLRPGGYLPLRGTPHLIRHSGHLRGLTTLETTAEGAAVLVVSGLEDHLPRRIATFLKKEARADLVELCAGHARTIGANISSISIKDTRSRWGSCSADGALSFSWRIVMAPPSVIDYLAAHEVAHLREMNHGPRFWALCQSLCPHMQEAKTWLKTNGSQLHAIDFG